MANEKDYKKPSARKQSGSGKSSGDTTEREYQDLYDLTAAAKRTIIENNAANLIENPQLGEVLTQRLDSDLEEAVREDMEQPPPPDSGLAQLIGIGPEAATEFGSVRTPMGVQVYDEEVNSERISAVADLYYIYQHEVIGVFKVCKKLQELFRAGIVRLSTGTGAYGLYQFDRRRVLRYTRNDRLAAYRRSFGYGTTRLPAGARANSDFHNLFSSFINQVALFWRDKRISDVIRERAQDPSFGSIAMVRRAGMDLRNNLKFSSYGHINVLRVEVMQLLDEAFRILGAEDVMRLFGAENAWDVVEEILVRYFNERLETSPRQRMAVTGREILRWLAQPNILQSQRAQFEALLRDIAEDAEEWLTSAEALGLAKRLTISRVMPWERNMSVFHDGKRRTEREWEYEY